MDDADRSASSGLVCDEYGNVIGAWSNVAQAVDYYVVVESSSTATVTIEPIMPFPPPPFPWRRFLARLAVFAAVTLALAFGAARVWE